MKAFLYIFPQFPEPFVGIGIKIPDFSDGGIFPGGNHIRPGGDKKQQCEGYDGISDSFHVYFRIAGLALFCKPVVIYVSSSGIGIFRVSVESKRSFSAMD
jgi:hypothetical protein